MGSGRLDEKLALAIQTPDDQVVGLVRIRCQLERDRSERGAAPRALLDRDGRRVLLAIPLIANRLRSGGVVALVAPLPHPVRRGRHADPEADFERPRPERLVRFAFEFECAHEGGGAAELVERQEAQRVAHQDAEPGRRDTGVTESAQGEREGSEAKICLSLPAAGREEEQVDALAVVVRRLDDARQVHQEERELEGAPAWQVDL
jgi:hypothetical protein